MRTSKPRTTEEIKASTGEAQEQPHIPPVPTPFAATFVRYVVGFGVSVSVGLSPYLGKLDVPGFVSLLRLVPGSLRDTMIPLSSALMGVVAVVVQYHGSQKMIPPSITKAFHRALLFSLVTFILLFVIDIWVVVKVPIGMHNGSESFLVGFSYPHRPPCENVGRIECIKLISLSDAAIGSYWGDTNIIIATIALMTAYLSFTGSFGLLVGLLVISTRKSKAVRI